MCAPGGIRTPNLLIRSQMLYPLSYGRFPLHFEKIFRLLSCATRIYSTNHSRFYQIASIKAQNEQLLHS